MPKPAKVLEISATITERGQTTVPAAIRGMLQLGKKDQVVFCGLADGTVVIAKKNRPDDNVDPVVGAFLTFLAKDMADHPSRIKGLPGHLIARGRTLVDGVDVDLDAVLPDE